MTTLPANPLQHMIAAAAKATPRDTGESARFRARHTSPGATRVILLDVSDSMAARAGSRRRIDHLRDALLQVVQPEHVLVTFSSSAARINSPADLPSPSGGTHLEAGLAKAAEYRPTATLVISDGEPTLPDRALAAAERLPGTVDVIYCGDESNKDAVEFMRRLARLGCGSYSYHAWAARPGMLPLAATIQRLLQHSA